MFNISEHTDTTYPVAQPKLVTAYPDTGASGHYFMADSSIPSFSTNPLPVHCPDGNTIISNSKIKLNLPNIPPEANEARVFNTLHNGNLLSIGALCDHNCKATFMKDSMNVKNPSGKLVLEGPRNATNGLWDVKIPVQTSPHQHAHIVNGVIRAKTSKSDLVEFLHKALGSPSISTFVKAIKSGFLSSFPGLTADLVNQHLPKSINTAKGHQQQIRQGFQSTKSNPDPVTSLQLPDGPERTDVILAAISHVPATGKAYGDLTGRYPVQSSNGHNYQLVIYHYDGNCILVEPIKSRQKGDILNAYRKIHKRLVVNGMKPKLQTLDNEASDILLQYMKSNKIDVQLAPPHMHRRNLAERDRRDI